MYGYEEQYIYGDISVNASKDSSRGVLLELRGMGCRNLEYVLQARGIDWYYFLRCCIDYQGVFKRIDLAINDMGGLLDIEILRERYYANKVWKRSRTHEAVDSGKLSGTNGDTAKTFYIGSKSQNIKIKTYFSEVPYFPHWRILHFPSESGDILPCGKSGFPLEQIRRSLPDRRGFLILLLQYYYLVPVLRLFFWLTPTYLLTCLFFI